MITNITLENFKCFRRLNIDPKGDEYAGYDVLHSLPEKRHADKRVQLVVVYILLRDLLFANLSVTKDSLSNLPE